ncbi:hypothetical protein HYQ46_000408 [Verticillium longisporum]|nr:hypothetical protein HYQ46_000408 [Verticillium longisporum]
MSDTSPSYSDCYFSFPNFDAWDGEDDTGREMSDTSPPYSDCYFSFPNFDAWDGEDDTGTKDDGIHFE